MILEKHFSFEPVLGLKCTNIEDVQNYIEGKISEFRLYENYTSKQKRLGLLDEILNMYDEDIQNPDVDLSPMNGYLYYDKVNVERMLQYYDFIFIFGSIILNCFDFDKNAINHTEDGINGPIDMGKMFFEAYCELKNRRQAEVITKQSQHAFGATLMFATILESELKRKFKSLFISEKLADLYSIIAAGNFTPNADQIELIKCLQQDPNAKQYNAVYGTTQAAYDLFFSAGVCQSGEEKNLLLNKTTLNQLLGYSFFQTKVEDSFLKMMQNLFGTGNLNLRNDIAHGGFGYQNYYHLAATSVLFMMATIVIQDEYLK